MSEADTERTKVPVTHRGKEQVYYARELGYFEFQELEEQLDHMPEKTQADKNRRGLALMKLITVASVETEDGTAVLTQETLRKLHKDVARPLSDAAMKAQGIDMEKIRKEAIEAEASGKPAEDEAADEGNG